MIPYVHTEEWIPMTKISKSKILVVEENSSESVPDLNRLNLENITKSTQEQFESTNQESYKISQGNLERRPSFHVIEIPDDFTESYRGKKELDQKESRTNLNLKVESKELDFPSFETQFFGSFGELANQHKKFDLTKVAHNSAKHQGHGHGYRPQIDHFSHQYQQSHHEHHPNYQDFPKHQYDEIEKPKREILSSYHHNSKPVHHNIKVQLSFSEQYLKYNPLIQLKCTSEWEVGEVQ